MTPRPRRSVAALVTAAATAAGLLLSAAPGAQAAMSGSNNLIVGELGSVLAVLKPDGTPQYTVNLAGREPVVAPDGSKIAYVDGRSLKIANIDGTGARTITDMPHAYAWDKSPSYSPAGRWIYFAGGYGPNQPQIMVMGSDGGYEPWPLFGAPTAYCDSQPSAGEDVLLFTRSSFNASTGQCSGPTSVWSYDLTTGQEQKLVDDADSGDVSPDGSTVAFVRRSGSAPELFTVPFAGGTPASVGQGDKPAWSPDSSRLAYVKGGNATWIRDVAAGTETLYRSGLLNPSWQPLNKNYVARTYGETAIDTSVAVSRFKYAGVNETESPNGKASVAVLTRADAFYDGLAGSALAGSKDGPMLLVPSTSIPASVSNELKRILAPGATVYLLGGTSALAPAVETSVRNLGFTPKRLAGTSMVDTAIAIANEMVPSTPQTVFLTTARDYYDGLAAGAAAASYPGSVVLFTDGPNMHPSTATYLNRINPNSTMVVAVGGPAEKALLSANLNWADGSPYWAVVGATAADTAADLAAFWYGSPTTSAVATLTSWQDALTGGALIAGRGPLLLSEPGRLSTPAAAYLREVRASMWQGIIVGGPNALSAAVAQQTGDAIGVPGEYVYIDMPGGVAPAPAPSARTFAPATAPAVTVPAEGTATGPKVTGPVARQDNERARRR